MTLALSLFIFAIGGVSTGLWGVLRHYGSRMMFSKLFSLCGYSFAAFFPAVVICSFPSSMLQWLFLSAGGVVAVRFLMMNLNPEIRRSLPETPRVAAWVFIVLVFSIVVVVAKTNFFVTAPSLDLQRPMSPDTTGEPIMPHPVPEIGGEPEIVEEHDSMHKQVADVRDAEVRKENNNPRMAVGIGGNTVSEQFLPMASEGADETVSEEVFSRLKEIGHS
eukprot:CAMPEP_0113845974 /NCGR_PEP_ID=MMETSP0372-20130328/1048_1 /TAXON_ID=340204 /ORGANISM="Lankesteria abbotti" /LENGTH=218 /DNA_ID=CAMNT_0000815063 /DNA_START=442 /DNA_END=1098 /DNA_ORIENTATION=+ /assembly_acc=CAM_ASM_000359